MSTPPPAGLFVGRRFLSPVAMLQLLDAFDALAGSWTASEALGLLGRGGASQVRPTDIAARAWLDQMRRALWPATTKWVETCGFRFPRAPQVQMFPVRMVGDAKTPAYQEPHVDSYAGQPHPPICTNVFYARTKAIVGGDLAVAADGAPELADPVIVKPAANTMVTFAGDRVHWVQPLLAGERLSVVINFY